MSEQWRAPTSLPWHLSRVQLAGRNWNRKWKRKRYTATSVISPRNIYLWMLFNLLRFTTFKAARWKILACIIYCFHSAIVFLMRFELSRKRCYNYSFLVWNLKLQSSVNWIHCCVRYFLNSLQRSLSLSEFIEQCGRSRLLKNRIKSACRAFGRGKNEYLVMHSWYRMGIYGILWQKWSLICSN